MRNDAGMILDGMQNRLEDYANANLYRRRHILPNDGVNFSSNDYLGLSTHPAVIDALSQSASYYGVGSGASHLVSGYTKAHQDCEEAFADFLNRPKALLFSNGYMANLGIISALTGLNDRILQDKHNHASLLDGAKLSAATSMRYQHASTDDLEKKLKQSSDKKTLVISDGVFSMGGDITPLPALVSLCQEYQATLMIDDAHALGVLGQTGRGSLEHHSLHAEAVPILTCPLGKAIGTYGAIVSGSDTFIESLIQFARSYTYTTAIPPAVAYASQISLETLQKETWRLDRLRENIHLFKEKISQTDLLITDSETAIQPIIVHDPEKAMSLSQTCHEKGIFVTAMRPPTVPPNQSMIRVTLNTHHSPKDLDRLVEALS